MMVVNLGITNAAANIGVGWEHAILIVLVLGSIIFMAKDFRIGIVMGMVSTGLLFMALFMGGHNYGASLVVMFMYLVILALTIIPTGQSQTQGGLN